MSEFLNFRMRFFIMDHSVPAENLRNFRVRTYPPISVEEVRWTSENVGSKTSDCVLNFYSWKC